MEFNFFSLLAHSLPFAIGNKKVSMNANPLNLCQKCVHLPTCILTHHHNSVFSCSEFDEIALQAPKPIRINTERALTLETI
ncbi:MAG: hypothetical protein COA40_03415 [Aequorivita sp.]|nr:MAG: hypothetical protein COA40_03415 [Aequorivita sp.]